MKILIPTDFSTTSRSHIDKLVNSLHETNTLTEILLLNTFIVKETDPALVIEANDKLKSVSRNSLEQLKLMILSNVQNPHIKVQTASHLGTLKNVIQQLLKKEKFDQIAVSSEEQAKELFSLKDFLREKACRIAID